MTTGTQGLDRCRDRHTVRKEKVTPHDREEGMKIRLAIGLAMILSAMTVAEQTTFSAAEAKDHIGAMATVCGKVISPRYAVSSRGQPTFLNLDKAYPNQVFTVLIWGAERSKFGTPEITYANKNVCVTGQIQKYQAGAEIVANNPKQIRVQER